MCDFSSPFYISFLTLIVYIYIFQVMLYVDMEVNGVPLKVVWQGPW